MSDARPRIAARLRRAAGIVLITLVATFGTTETLLRLARYRIPLLRTLLYSRGEPVPYARLDDTRALLDLSPFHPRPFQKSAGFKLNSLGLRTHEYERAKPAGTYRIVALGDSFTFDSGFVPLEAMWHSLVGERIRARTGRAVEVINLGVPGVGPRFALRLFEVEGRQLSPDLVLFGLFVGNDLTDDAPPPSDAWSLERWCLTCRLVTHAIALTGVEGSVLSPAESGPGGFPVPGYTYNPDGLFAAVTEEAFLRSEQNQSYVFAKPVRARVEDLLADVVDAVVTLDGEVRRAGGELVVAIIPDQVQVDLDIRQAMLAGAPFPADAYDFDWLQPALMEHLVAAGISAIDLLPAMRAAPSTPRLYRRRNTHWSAAGNALAAEAIAAFLGDRARGP